MTIAGAHQGKESIGRLIRLKVGSSNGASHMCKAAERMLDDAPARKVRETALTRALSAIIWNVVTMIPETPHQKVNRPELTDQLEGSESPQYINSSCLVSLSSSKSV